MKNERMIPNAQSASYSSIVHYHDVRGYGRFGSVRMRRVVHLGPIGSKGGMSTVVASLCFNPPDNWISESIPTHSERGLMGKYSAYINAKRELKSSIHNGGIDVAHFHVTHGVSWWRKRLLMRICQRSNLPFVVHIHSGRFDDYCSGIAGGSVRGITQNSNCRVVVLEDRWLKKLESWIPEDSVVIRNSSDSICVRGNHIPKEEVKLLMLSRDSFGKGHDFALRVLESLHSQGIGARLVMTGKSSLPRTSVVVESVEAMGWIGQEEKARAISEADFLLMPSEFEGSSMSVIEAMVSGLPPIVSTASAETVGVSSLVLPLDAPEAWAERIASLRQPRAYRDTVESILVQAERYSPELARFQWGALYESLLLGSDDGD